MGDTPASKSRGPNLRWLRSRPSSTLRLIFRLPIYLYRLNLGWLLGYRALLLIHQGRKSGLLRETVLEVIRYDPATKESVVLSGWGEKADWYRNIQVAPAMEVQTGGGSATCQSSGFYPQRRTMPRSPTMSGAILWPLGSSPRRSVTHWAKRRLCAKHLRRLCDWWPSAPEMQETSLGNLASRER